MSVDTVNGQTGTVLLTAADIPDAASESALATVGGAQSIGFDWSSSPSKDTAAWGIQTAASYINILRYIPPDNWADIVAGTSCFDCSCASQAAVDAAVLAGGGTVFYPEGTYLHCSTIREPTNGGAVRLLGANKIKTVIKAGPALAAPLFWFGNSNGHSVYRGEISNICFTGPGAAVEGSVALRLHEWGVGHVHDIRIQNFEYAEQWIGVIGTTQNGSCEISACAYGIVGTTPASGIPSDPNDITTTASKLALNGNANKIEKVWFSAIDKNVVVCNGGLTHVIGNVIQNCGNDVSEDLILLQDANESYDYGAGPLVHGNWIEGGSYRYAIASRSTRIPSIRWNFISGSSSPVTTNAPKEGAILLSDSPQFDCNENSIQGYFVSSATESRATPAGIYVAADSRSHTARPMQNYVVKSQCNEYHEGVASPDIGKPRVPHWAAVEISTGIAAVTSASSDWIGSFTKNGPGDFSVIFKFNREMVASGMYPVHATVQTNSATKTYSVSVFGTGNAGNNRLIFKTDAGVLEDPPGFTLSIFGGYQGI